ncbi:MAG TPA: efflux RND transporter periplasmic adaptor subunit [Gammaproteobacteria bacterium]|nr:efflux RND transporter periplasmic adaptor subunit [Gammaproteobacteria bacterium]
MPAQVTSSIAAPGEVKLNAYRTIKITPRIAAQVIKRHARLGDLVKKGQPLVTLSSVEMASAQGRLLVADREWQRVRKLGRKVLSGRRYTEAKVARSLALSKVKAYGMSQPQIDRLLKDSNTMLSDGTFQLLSTLNARVLHDDFIVGERVDAGKVLMIISDESVMWVEARITADQMKLIKIGNLARVRAGNKNLSATVSQLHHTLDEITRTLAIRMEVKNPGDILHPGMFVKVIIQTSDKITAFVLPESAVLRSQDGDWQILVEQDEPGEFKPVEVKLLRVSNGKAVIEGIKPGTRVVTQGAFFVQSELAKAGFKIHNH